MSKNTFIPTTKGLVSAHKSQDFTSDQKAQARTNIAAAASTHTHSADDIVSGALAKARQHAQTAYKDEANTWAQAQTFANATTFNGVVNANNVGANIRVKANGSDALDGAVLVNGLGNIYLSNWNADRGIRINADGSMATIGSGVFTFNGNVAVGIGTALAPLHVGDQAFTNSGDPVVLCSRVMVGAGNSHGFSDSSTFKKNAGTAYNSFDGRITFGESGVATNYDHYAAFQAAPDCVGAGVTSYLYGLYSTVVQSAGTTTNVYGGYVADATGGGTVVNQYGFYVAQLSKGTTRNYAIYTDGNTPSYFGGAVIVDSYLSMTTYVEAGTFIRAPKLQVTTGGTFLFGIDSTNMEVLTAGGAMANFRAKGLSASDSDTESIPTNGMYSKGDIKTAGEILGSASTTTRASINLPHGTAPTSPVDGDIWTTSAGLFVRINGATIGPLS